MDKEYESANIEKPEITFLENVLSDNVIYNIPPFQRNYSWDTNNCKVLFEDIKTGFEQKKKHFIGIIMYYNEAGSTGNKHSNVLIDGQQRLTTIMILLCAIRDYTDNKELKKQINNFIKNSNVKLNKFKLKQNNNDDTHFIKILEGKTIDLSNKILMKKNYDLFFNEINNNSNIDYFSFFEYIKKLETVEIVLKRDNINNVQEIFEKINSTGKTLTSADLVRNFVLFTSDVKKQHELYIKWVWIEKIVGLDDVSKFIRAYTIRNIRSILNIDDVYSEFKKYFENQEKEKIIDDMLKYAIYYSIITNNQYYNFLNETEPEIIKKDNTYLDNTLRLLNALRTDDIIPLIMQLYSILYERDNQLLSDILELLLEFMIRYRIVKPSSGGGSLDSKIYGIMEDIENKKIKLTLKNFYNELSSSENGAASYPNNEKFLERLRTDMDQRNGRVLLFQYARRTKYESNSYIFNSKVSLEHLMPQTIKENTENGMWWIKHIGKKSFQKTYKDYLDCIGNYGLLSTKLNETVSNNKWYIKRERILADAIDENTKQAAKSKNWKKEDISKRNKEFSNQIVQYITGPKSENNKNKKWLKGLL